MRIGVLQASSQQDKNDLLYRCTAAAGAQSGHETINFGCFAHETGSFSYPDIALEACLLLCGGAVDFVVTGCASGQGMMLACNALPGVLCGYVQNPTDAYLFGRINDGNAVSLPLMQGFGWAGEQNLAATLGRLFCEPFGVGYPPDEAARKRADAQLVKSFFAASRRSVFDVLDALDPACLHRALMRTNVLDFLAAHGSSAALIERIAQLR